MTWQSLLFARLEAIVDGTTPADGVSGRSITPGTFVKAKVYGDLLAPEYPAEHLHRAYQLVDMGFAPTDDQRGVNARAGQCRRHVRVDLIVGYVGGRGAPGTTGAAGHGPHVTEALSGADAHLLEQALTWPDFWGTLNASPALGLFSVGLVESRPEWLVRGQRLVRRTTLDVGVAYVPGATYP